MKEKQKWFLPVGLYPDQMDSLEALHKHLMNFGLPATNLHVHALYCMLNYFKSEHNDAYQYMKKTEEWIISAGKKISCECYRKGKNEDKSLSQSD